VHRDVPEERKAGKKRAIRAGDSRGKKRATAYDSHLKR